MHLNARLTLLPLLLLVSVRLYADLPCLGPALASCHAYVAEHYSGQAAGQCRANSEKMQIEFRRKTNYYDLEEGWGWYYGSWMNQKKYQICECEDPWSHEGGGTECGMCAPTHTDAGEDVMPRCQLIEEPEDCAEKGEYYEQDGYCTAECQSGSALGNQCLQEPEAQCYSSSDDYLGNIGYGGNQKPVCGDNQCSDGGTYGFEEQSDGSYKSQCFPQDSKPPKCPAGAAVIIGSDKASFQCSEIDFDSPDDDPTPDEDSDGDSDGDGEGDITGITNQLSEIKELLGKGNLNTTNINETLKGIGKGVKDGTQAITDAIGNIPGGGGGGNGNGDENGEGEGGDPVTWNGDPIDTELADPTEDYDQVMADYQAKISEIKGEVQAMFSTNLTGGGSVDNNIKTIKGEEVNFSLNRFLDGLDILGAIVLFCAAFISAGILFTSRG
ncbi:hypothetical protein [Marinobacter xestospongiae]|uniref:hypothetical protein n=1 Tax=Marinobacter xestospongiae TaxID=994319 RepID=UPI00200411DF|nr:hypothetical protein [Marinobacter xestospongiae]MCK7569082.1 hypothetical protein [Marinobacter xestospongiae]